MTAGPFLDEQCASARFLSVVADVDSFHLSLLGQGFPFSGATMVTELHIARVLLGRIRAPTDDVAFVRASNI